MQRVASVVRDIAADAIQNRLNDPRIEPLTSVTRVEMSPDLSVAHIHLSVLAPPPRQRLTLRAVEGARGRIRALVADGIDLRHAPELHFHLDDSIQRSFETVQVIERAMAELRPAQADVPQSAESNDPPGPPDGPDVPAQEGH